MSAAPVLFRGRQSIEDVLREKLSEKYHVNALQKLGEGTTRLLYAVPWGPGKRWMVIKVDKDTFESPRAQRHFDRGCNTENELRAKADIKGLEQHHWVGLHDYINLESSGLGWATVEPFVGSISPQGELEPAETLEQRVKRAKFSKAEYNRFASQLFAGIQHLYNQGWYSRDTHSENILLAASGSTFDVQLLDLTNACKINHPSPQALPTAGKHFILDLLLPEQFTGEQRAYDLQAELYALGDNLFFAATGKHVIEVDPDTNTVVDFKTRKSLLGKDGYVDRHAYKKTLEKALKEVEHKAFRPIIEHLLTADPRYRYDSLDNLERHIREAGEPSSFSKFMGTKVGGTIGALGVAAAIGAAIFFGDRSEFMGMQRKLEQANYITIHPGVDVTDQSVTNDRVSMTVSRGFHRFTPSSPFDSIITVNPGDTLRFTPEAFAIPGCGGNGFSCGLPNLRGRTYIEGLKADTFNVYVTDKSISSDGEGGFAMPSSGRIIVPKDMPTGIYYADVELLAYDDTLPRFDWGNAPKIRVIEPSQVINRMRFPIMVHGTAPQHQLVTRPSFSFSNASLYSSGISRVYPRPAIDFHQEITVLGENFSTTEEANLDLPRFSQRDTVYHRTAICRTNRCDVESDYAQYARTHVQQIDIPDHNNRMLQVVNRDGNRVIGWSFYDIEQNVMTGNNNYVKMWWTLRSPSGDFAERALEARKHFYPLQDDARK